MIGKLDQNMSTNFNYKMNLIENMPTPNATKHGIIGFTINSTQNIQNFNQRFKYIFLLFVLNIKAVIGNTTLNF